MESDCGNCGHPIVRDYSSDMQWEHLTRYWKDYSYPYATMKCHAPACKCEKPEPIKEVS